MKELLFNQVYDIMVNSFPNKEIRSYQGQYKILDDENYKLYVELENDNEVVSFLSCWEFKELAFIEHFATRKDHRGLGIGNEFLSDYIKNKIVLNTLNDDTNPIILISKNNTVNEKKNIILEVDPPTTEIAKKRIKFYKKLNFNLNPFYYEQPPLGDNNISFNLKIMSYPKPLNKEQFKIYTNIIKEKVYRYK